MTANNAACWRFRGGGVRETEEGWRVSQRKMSFHSFFAGGISLHCESRVELFSSVLITASRFDVGDECVVIHGER